MVAEAFIDFDGDNLGLFFVEPFKSRKDEFNLWYIKEVLAKGECTGDCLPQQIMSLAENCPYRNKYVVNLNTDGVSTKVGERIMLFVAPISPIGLENLAPPFVHESGHLFGNGKVADEYILFPDKRYEEETSTSIFGGHKNCYAGPAHTSQECLDKAPWKDFIGNGCGQEGVIDCSPSDQSYPLEVACFEGCSKDGLGIFRPTLNSIMNSAGIEIYSYGPWNQKLIEDELKKYNRYR